MKSNSVLIIGASRGIGKALAFEFAKNGWDLFLASRDIENLKTIKSEIESKYSVDCIITVLDVTSDKDYELVFSKIRNQNHNLDLIILNSGISKPINLSEIDENIIRQIFETNFFGIVRGMKFAVDYFKIIGKGHIATVSSLADARGFPGSSAYVASKTAISHFTEAASIELRKSNINVTLIKPGFVITDMTANHKFTMPFLISAEKSAKIIYSGIKKGKKQIYFPLPTAIGSYLIKILPGFIFRYLTKFWKGENG
ncbi:MAG: hypothetical protein A2X64_05455 [Ignavibacteria bacterium GWF2_33_9]|nr:MAG: hypothetical protein A2X64_05455 [Ignavibacteria bacterium GWF2_33_9]